MRTTFRNALLLVVSGGPFLCGAAAPSWAGSPDTESPETGDQSLESFQDDMLDLAFQISSALPLQPHVKTRCRYQESAVATCLELHQPERAHQYANKIVNWRRGSAYADIAYYYARNDDLEQAEVFLKKAHEYASSMKIALGKDEDGEQPWRRGRILVKIARTYAWLGDGKKAAEYAAGAEQADTQELEVAAALKLDSEAFDAQVVAIDKVLERGGFDEIRPVLAACVELYDRFYEDADKRAKMEERVRADYKQVPASVRIDFLLELNRRAAKHWDFEKAQELAQAAQRVVEGARWSPEHHIPLTAKVAEAFHRAQDERKAKLEAGVALAMFESERDRIVDIFRPEALLPLAEAFHAMEDWASALEVYKTAVHESVQNVNSRPRAEDLTATCLSLARHGVQPDNGLRQRILAEFDNLGSPW